MPSALPSLVQLLILIAAIAVIFAAGTAYFKRTAKRRHNK